MGVIRSTKGFKKKASLKEPPPESTKEAPGKKTSSESLNEVSLKCTMDAPLKFVEEMFFETTKKASVIFMKKGSPNYMKQGKDRVKDLIDLGYFKEYEKSIDVPTFCFKSILVATNNFSPENKLGQGGFGAVYKGNFPGGQELAVKRLSRYSGQGLQEFKNEVVFVPKLQHRNLVRLLGYCIEGDEMILLYEYMPNGSLDSFMFDQTRRVYLDWEMRFNIIFGIARGLLYLHQDSRMRIIHRDLKPSNVLLDDDMNPKISDFGLASIVGDKEIDFGSARIFGDKEIDFGLVRIFGAEVFETFRVVGTYGYMAPEYVMQGILSVKSDVFSFGVVLIEIVSGKRNTSFYDSKPYSDLLNYVWTLWTDNRVLDLMDQTLQETYNAKQFVKCINIGLLCVQEDPSDRPTMWNVVTMLDTDNATIPIPKKAPSNFKRGGVSRTPTFFSSMSQNHLTNTLEAR